MKKLTTIIFLVGFIELTGIYTIYGKNLLGLEIMQKNDKQQRVKDEQVIVTMKLIDKNGKTRVRKIEQFSKTKNDNKQKILIRFLSPADIKGTGLLTIEHANRDDDRWLYLPALKKIRRIAGSDKSNKFMGTDFSYEDLGSEELKKYDYELSNSETVNNIDCYHITAIPNNDKEKEESGYSKREIWVGKDNLFIMKVEYFDKKGKSKKIYMAEDIRLVPGTKKLRSYRMVMKDLKKKHKTILQFDNFKINKGTRNNIFTLRFLKR